MGDSWTEWRQHILSELEQSRQSHARSLDILLQLKGDVSRLRGVSALISGTVATIIAAVATALMLAATGCSPYPAPTMPAGGEALSAYVVGLVDASGRVYCSGVLAEQGIYTAAHCVRGTSIRVGLRADHVNGRWDRAYITSPADIDMDHDSALLRAPPEWRRRARLRSRPVEQGERVTAVGHPYGYTYTHHRGYVSHASRDHSRAPRRFFTLDSGLLPGMSGGPVFDVEGYVVGIVSFYVGSPHLGGAIPVDALPEGT